MSEELIVEQCSPTLAGIKTGSLFTVPSKNGGELKESIKRLNSVMVPRGIRVIPVKKLKSRVLIYLYDMEAAKKKFALYNKCTGLYKKAYRKHNSFDRLIVSC